VPLHFRAMPDLVITLPVPIVTIDGSRRKAA
jgi:hypothetical protein